MISLRSMSTALLRLAALFAIAFSVAFLAIVLSSAMRSLTPG